MTALDGLTEIYQRWVADEPEGLDPTERLFFRWRIGANAVIRAHYARLKQALADRDALRAQIADAQAEGARKVAAIRSLWRTDDAAPPSLSDADADLWNRLETQRSYLEKRIDRLREKESPLETRIADESQQWDRAWASYCPLRWALHGPAAMECRPDWLSSDGAGVVWEAPDGYRRRGFEAELARWEQ